MAQLRFNLFAQNAVRFRTVIIRSIVMCDQKKTFTVITSSIEMLNNKNLPFHPLTHYGNTRSKFTMVRKNLIYAKGNRTGN